MGPSCGPACDDGESLPEYHHPVAFACKAEGLWSDRVQQVPFEVDEDGGSCCWEAEPSLSAVEGAAEGEEEPDRFGEPDGVAVVEEVTLLRMEESFRLGDPLVEVAVVAEAVAEE